MGTDVRTGRRRRLLKLGAAGGAATVLSVVSRSTFATVCGGGCSTTPSAFGSINQSRPDAIVCRDGKSPGYWKQEQHFNDWPSGYFPRDIRNSAGTVTQAATKFADRFAGASGGNLDTATLLQVLSPELGIVNNSLARALACALLNAADGKTIDILTVENIMNIWNEFRTRGYYEPIAGIKWYATTSVPARTEDSSGIVGYLETTWS